MPKKKEVDGLHPASHYLVVEDTDSPSTWHLRVRNMAGELDHRLMGAAWAALHEGYRGNKYAGPGKESALEKLKALYDREGMEEPGEEEDAEHMEKAASAISGFDSEWAWVGVSHNSYKDVSGDILPLALLQRDLTRQSEWIAAGRFKDYGPLLVNHHPKLVVGRTLFKAIVPGTRMVLEAGTILPQVAAPMAGMVFPMSLGYWYAAKESGEYVEFVQNERSVLVGKSPMNTLTRFKVYKREDATLGALTHFTTGDTL